MRTHDKKIRMQVINLYLHEGLSIREISRQLSISRPTIKEWIDRHEKSGEQGLSPHYASSGRSTDFSKDMLAKAFEYKSAHPKWGATYILIKLKDAFPNQRLPSARWLQKLFHQKELHPKRTRLPKAHVGWATKAFSRVQVDAKERLKTADGQDCCYLNFTDEYTGSELEAFIFPLCTN